MAEVPPTSPDVRRVRRRDITLGVFFGMSLFMIFWSLLFAVAVPLVGIGGAALYDHFMRQDQHQQQKR